MANISERLKQFIEYQGVSVRAFEQKIGASNGLIGTSIKKSSDIQSKWLSKIIETYPALSSLWLLTGSGEMLLENIKRAPPEDIKCDNCAILEEKLKEKEETITDLRASIDDKNEIIRMLKQKASTKDSPETRKTA